MDDIRKRAYKALNYQALLDIKNSGSFNEDSFYRIYRIAHAFHNLAEHIVQDFEGFDEEIFWSTIDPLEIQFGMYHYRKLFDDAFNNC
ncbi:MULTISPECIES: hypothetical protein [unclassified Paenibacillus]|uniref:hypothetical protein n=1 Tax=unclassified Paenibacillus TaxID=185978 RepID=UPI003626ED07